LDFHGERADQSDLNKSGVDFQLLVRRLARGGPERRASAILDRNVAARDGGTPAPQDYGLASKILFFAVMHRKGSAQQIRLVNKR
jgi:hypothetical protein